MTDKLHTNILAAKQLRLFNTLRGSIWMKPFYMAGRKAVALQIAHRWFVDFDFFIPRDFSTKIIIPKLTTLEEFEFFDEASKTINGSLNDIKISFFSYNYNRLRALIVYNKMAIASMLDIAFMKLGAIAVRESKKAFFDLYFLLKYYKLNDLFGQYPKKVRQEPCMYLLPYEIPRLF